MVRLLLAAAAATLAGCGTRTVVHTVTVPAARAVSQVDTIPAPHVPTGEPPGSGDIKCPPVRGVIVWGSANTSCGFARNVFLAALASFHRTGTDGKFLTAYSPTTRRSYRVTCDIDSTNSVNCFNGGGAIVSFTAFATAPTPPAPEPAVSTPAASAPPAQAGPDRALCHDLYDQWRAGDTGSQAAIEQYAQMGCDQAPPASAGANCPAYYSPWGYAPNGAIICAPQAGTPADRGNGDYTVTVPASR